MPLLHFSEEFFCDFESVVISLHISFTKQELLTGLTLHIQRSIEHLCVSCSNHDFVKKVIKRNPL